MVDVFITLKSFSLSLLIAPPAQSHPYHPRPLLTQFLSLYIGLYFLEFCRNIIISIYFLDGFFHSIILQFIHVVVCIKNLLLSHFSRVRPCATPEMAAHQAPVPGSLQARTLEWVAISFSSA